MLWLCGLISTITTIIKSKIIFLFQKKKNHLFIFILFFLRRITAIGCQCGLVKVTIVEIETLKIIKEWTLRYASPVSSVRIFSRSSKKKLKTKNEILDILVVNALGSTVVFT